MDITKPSITRLSHKAGVKSLSENCYPLLRALINQTVQNIVEKALLVNSETQTKTLMVEDIYEALRLQGVHLAESDKLGTTTVGKS